MVIQKEINRVERFLSRGIKEIPGDVSDFAAECNLYINSVASKSLSESVRVAKRFVKRAIPIGGLLLATARRSLARTLHMSGEYKRARIEYTEARKLYRNDLRMRSLIDRALIDVYMYAGDYKEAKRRATMALKGFTELNQKSDIAKTRVNYANLLHRQDLHREAEQLYAEAATYFESINDPLATARCYYNRANTLVQLFEFDLAEQLYLKSKEMYLSKNQTVDANDADYGQAWSLMLRGEFHRSLLELQKCEIVYKEIGNPKGAALCLLDKAELLLNLSLFHQAFNAVEIALARFKKLGIRYEEAKAQYFRGVAAIPLGKSNVAHRSLSFAFEAFKKENNYGFMGACLLMKSRLLSNSKEKMAELEKARKYFSKGQLVLWQAVCDLELAEQSEGSDVYLSRIRTNPVVKTVPTLYAQWQTIRGDSEARGGKLDKAIECWERAANRIDMIRSSLPPVEQRSSYMTDRDSPHLRLVENLLLTNPSLSSAWAERSLTAGTWAPLHDDEDDEQIADINSTLCELATRMAAVQRYSLGQNKRSTTALGRTNKSLESLQTKLRDQIIKAEKLQQGRPQELDSLADSFQRIAKKQPVIQFIPVEDNLLAFVHTKSGICQHKFQGGVKKVAEYMEHWRFLIERYQVSEDSGSSLHLTQERKLLSSLGDWLWKPLGLEAGYKDVLVITSGVCANIPWQGLIVDGLNLGDTLNVFQCPSLRHYLKAVKIKVKSQKIFLFSGQLKDTPMAKKEVQYLNRLNEGKSIVFLPSSRSDWPTKGSYALWHYAGHAYMRSDNPFYSYLDLVDGPLFAVDFRTREVLVELVVLAACRTGEQNTSGEVEPTGLVRSLMEMGARNIIASKWPISDKVTSKWMKYFYQNYFNGVGLSESYRLATNQIRMKNPSAYYWAPFTLFGAN